MGVEIPSIGDIMGKLCVEYPESLPAVLNLSVQWDQAELAAEFEEFDE